MLRPLDPSPFLSQRRSIPQTQALPVPALQSWRTHRPLAAAKPGTNSASKTKLVRRKTPTLLFDPSEFTVNQLLERALEVGDTSLDLSSRSLTEIPPQLSDLQHMVCINWNSPGSLSDRDYSFGFDDDSLTSAAAGSLIRRPLNNDSFHDYGSSPSCSYSSSSSSAAMIKLDLANNCIRFIEPKLLMSLSNLTFLSLRNNNLTHLPREIKHLVHLTELSLGGNQFQYLPSELCLLSMNPQLTVSAFPNANFLMSWRLGAQEDENGLLFQPVGFDARVVVNDDADNGPAQQPSRPYTLRNVIPECLITSEPPSALQIQHQQPHRYLEQKQQQQPLSLLELCIRSNAPSHAATTPPKPSTPSPMKTGTTGAKRKFHDQRIPSRVSWFLEQAVNAGFCGGIVDDNHHDSRGHEENVSAAPMLFGENRRCRTLFSQGTGVTAIVWGTCGSRHEERHELGEQGRRQRLGDDELIPFEWRFCSTRCFKSFCEAYKINQVYVTKP
ncbi:hypothetical protein BDR26DRAFT_687646 [Obelidium mucronatum]|nr:hypothetical protein BDR26DRAFT_687646 [Obelidium mucronatum]